jgi:hypothetical protein
VEDDGTEGGFLDWVESGWGDALESWEHPIQSTENAVEEIWNGLTGTTSQNAAAVAAIGDDPGDTTSGLGTLSSPAIWGYIIAAIVILFLIAYTAREVAG